MTVDAYLDSSVLLRLVLQEPGTLTEFAQIERSVSSELLSLECLRVIDRLRHLGTSADLQLERIKSVRRHLEHIDLMPVSRRILQQASQPFPVALGTLDAIHLSTVLAYRNGPIPHLVLATHDKQLRKCAALMEIPTVG